MAEFNSSTRIKPKKKEELTLPDIFRIINNRRSIILFSVILLLALAFVYNKTTKPVYEASVMLKKDKSNQEKSEKEDLKDIVLLQSPDEIETEMEIVKTRDVLEKVIDALQLYLTVDKITRPGGQILNMALQGVDYKKIYSRNISSGIMPDFVKIKQSSSRSNYDFYIKKLDSLNFGLFNRQNDSLITVSKTAQSSDMKDSTALASADTVGNAAADSELKEAMHSYAAFEIAGLKMVFSWPLAPAGNRVYFSLDDYYNTMEKLKKNLKVEHVIKTDIFSITVESTSPYAAQKIANTAAEKFREMRINQQKQSIHYSFNFVDKQLQDVWNKLKNAEGELSNYKSARQITSIDESSRSLVNFLSNLEAERIKTNLELTENQDKLTQMQNELKLKGYIDETYLTPHSIEQSGSPFSNLLKQLSDLEIQRIELLQKRKESHPEIVIMDQRIKQIKDKLALYNNNTLTAYQILINSAKKKQEELNTLTAKYANRIENLPPEESHLAELIRQKNVYDKIFTMLLNQREEMRMAELSKLQDIIIVDQAHEPIKPIHPKEYLNYAIALLAGIFLGFAGITIKEIRHRKMLTLEDVENNFDIPIFAIIPNYTRDIIRKIRKAKKYEDSFVTMMNGQDGFRESYRVLKTKLKTRLNNDGRIIMFTSCEENTGKTSVVSNLAISLAHSNKKVLIVDFDLKKASLTKAFNMKIDSPGVITFLSKNYHTPDIYHVLLGENGDTIRTLDILPAGGISESSGDLINSEKMKKMLSYLNTLYYDYILFDTPPVTRVVDVLALGKFVKDSFLVIKPELTLKDSVEWGIKEMEQQNINIYGIIVNACDIKRSSFRYRYGYGYGYAHIKNYRAETN